MLATPGTLPEGPQWLYEVKWDGWRLIAEIADGRLRLTTRTGRDVTLHFPELAPLAGAVADAVLDGEVVVLAAGVPSFAGLADRIHSAPPAGAPAVTFMVFDILRLYGVSLLDRPLEERRNTLERLGLEAVEPVALSPVYDDGRALLEATAKRGLEGVLAKRRDSAYRPGRRTPNWVKVAHRRSQACLVGGWRSERSTPSRIGSLLLGVPDAANGLQFVGRVGSGVAGDAMQRVLRKELTPLTTANSPFSERLPRTDALGATWCDPKLVVEVNHSGWTEAARLRQPVLRGIRDDVEPASVRRDS
jgi:bifunctional non-homologous end joining protein LigD